MPTYVYVMPRELIEMNENLSESERVARDDHYEICAAMQRRIAVMAPTLAEKHVPLAINVVPDAGTFENAFGLYLEDGQPVDDDVAELLSPLIIDAQEHAGQVVFAGRIVTIGSSRYQVRSFKGVEYVATEAAAKHLGVSLEHVQRLCAEATTITGAVQPTGSRGRWLVPVSFFGDAAKR